MKLFGGFCSGPHRGSNGGGGSSIGPLFWPYLKKEDGGWVFWVAYELKQEEGEGGNEGGDGVSGHARSGGGVVWRWLGEDAMELERSRWEEEEGSVTGE